MCFILVLRIFIPAVRTCNANIRQTAIFICPFTRRENVTNLVWGVSQLTPNEGGSTPILQFVSDAPYAPAGFFLADGASLPRRMLIDAMSCRARFVGLRRTIVGTVLEILNFTTGWAFFADRSDIQGTLFVPYRGNVPNQLAVKLVA